MANESIQNLAANVGETTRDDVLKEELLRRIIYAESGSMSVGTQLVGTETMGTLGVEFTYPGEMTAEYDVDMESTTSRQKISWKEFNMRLKQGQTRYFIADSAKLQGLAGVQRRMTRRRASEALARRKDENILGALMNGAYSENEQAAADPWNSTSVDVDLVDELWDMWKDILVNAPLNNTSINNFSVVLPVEVWAETNRLELINNIQQRVRDYLGQTFGFSLYPTKLGMHDDDDLDLQDTAIMLIPGQDTAIHGELDAATARSNGVPLVEEERVFGQGVDHLIKQWYNTKVIEHESGEADKSPRISVRTNVNANA